MLMVTAADPVQEDAAVSRLVGRVVLTVLSHRDSDTDEKVGGNGEHPGVIDSGGGTLDDEVCEELLKAAARGQTAGESPLEGAPTDRAR